MDRKEEAENEWSDEGGTPGNMVQTGGRGEELGGTMTSMDAVDDRGVALGRMDTDIADMVHTGGREGEMGGNMDGNRNNETGDEESEDDDMECGNTMKEVISSYIHEVKEEMRTSLTSIRNEVNNTARRFGDGLDKIKTECRLLSEDNERLRQQLKDLQNEENIRKAVKEEVGDELNRLRVAETLHEVKTDMAIVHLAMNDKVSKGSLKKEVNDILSKGKFSIQEEDPEVETIFTMLQKSQDYELVSNDPLTLVMSTNVQHQPGAFIDYHTSTPLTTVNASEILTPVLEVGAAASSTSGSSDITVHAPEAEVKDANKKPDPSPKRTRFRWEKKHQKQLNFLHSYCERHGMTRGMTHKMSCFKAGVQSNMWIDDETWRLRVFNKLDRVAKHPPLPASP